MFLLKIGRSVRCSENDTFFLSELKGFNFSMSPISSPLKVKYRLRRQSKKFCIYFFSFIYYLTHHCIQLKYFLGQTCHIADVCDFLLHVSLKIGRSVRFSQNDTFFLSELKGFHFSMSPISSPLKVKYRLRIQSKRFCIYFFSFIYYLTQPLHTIEIFPRSNLSYSRFL